MKKLVFLALIGVLVFGVTPALAPSPTLASGPIMKNYGDVILSGASQSGNFPQVWDLNACDLVISFTYDANGLVDDFGGGAHAWAELGVRAVGYGNFNPTWMTEGAGVWLATDYHWAANTFDPDPLGAPTLDIDDKLILQKAGGCGEGDYNLPSTPPNPWANHAIWFDRDGVDQWQAQMWGAIDGVTYNTGGTYDVVITLHADNATSGTAYMTVNGEPQGFYVPNWHSGPADLMPAGMTFTGDMTEMQVFYGLYGYGATHGVAFEDITVEGCLHEFEVDIDIKPGSDPNSINLDRRGVVPVAVLTTDDFDAGTVDPSTVEFAGALPVRWVMCDVDGDGDVDLLFHFKTQDLKLTYMWTEYSGNPVFGQGIGGPKAYYPSVLYDADTFSGHGVAAKYKMWYGTSSSQTGLAISDDGISWADQGVVMSNGYHATVEYYTDGFTGVNSGGTPSDSTMYYRMWYWDPVKLYDVSAIGYTESPDGVNWYNYQPLQNGTVPIVSGGDPWWNRGSYGPCDVLYNPSASDTGTDWTFTMYYDGTTGGDEAIGLAFSSDGIRWTGYDADSDGKADPVLDGTYVAGDWDKNYVSRATIIKNADDDYEMWYSGGVGTMNHGIGYATSSDGINWTRDADNPIFHKDDGVGWRDSRTYCPAVLKDGSCYKMWFAGKDNETGDYSIGYAATPALTLVGTTIYENPIQGMDTVNIVPKGKNKGK